MIRHNLPEFAMELQNIRCLYIPAFVFGKLRLHQIIFVAVRQLNAYVNHVTARSPIQNHIMAIRYIGEDGGTMPQKSGCVDFIRENVENSCNRA